MFRILSILGQVLTHGSKWNMHDNENLEGNGFYSWNLLSICFFLIDFVSVWQIKLSFLHGNDPISPLKNRFFNEFHPCFSKSKYPKDVHSSFKLNHSHQNSSTSYKFLAKCCLTQ
jgi:hypothetical protein